MPKYAKNDSSSLSQASQINATVCCNWKFQALTLYAWTLSWQRSFPWWLKRHLRSTKPLRHLRHQLHQDYPNHHHDCHHHPYYNHHHDHHNDMERKVMVCRLLVKRYLVDKLREWLREVRIRRPGDAMKFEGMPGEAKRWLKMQASGLT